MSNIDEDEVSEAAEKIMGILTRDEPRRSFDGYAHPDTRERAKKGIESVKQEKTTDKNSPQVQRGLSWKTCAQCGEEFLLYKNGCMEPNICRNCLSSKIQKGLLKHYGKNVSEEPMDGSNATTLTLTFGKRDARVYEAVCASAERDRRTPENQVLHFLEMALNGFASDVVFALEETINREE